jgi:transcriptional antiterminator NusG
MVKDEKSKRGKKGQVELKKEKKAKEDTENSSEKSIEEEAEAENTGKKPTNTKNSEGTENAKKTEKPNAKPANTEKVEKSEDTESENDNADDNAGITESKDSKKEQDNKKESEDEEHKLQEKGTGKKKISGHIVINKKDNPEAKWYVVHTASGHEVRVAQTLRQRVETQMLEGKIFEILVPTQDRVVIRSGKKQNIKEKIFPGYLLVKLILDDPTWLAVRTTPGITGFVGTGKTPTPLSEAEVANIQKFVATPAKRFKTKFSKGEAVKITDGPFSGFLGSVDDIDEEKGKVKVLVSIFGRETPVELDLLQITKV